MEQSKVIITSGKGEVNYHDVIHSLLVAMGTPVFTIIINSLEAGNLTFDWKNILGTALAAGLGYLGKKFLTPSQTIIKSK